MVRAIEDLSNPKDLLLSIKANKSVLPYSATRRITPIMAKIRFVFFIFLSVLFSKFFIGKLKHFKSAIFVYYSKEIRKFVKVFEKNKDMVYNGHIKTKNKRRT